MLKHLFNLYNGEKANKLGLRVREDIIQCIATIILIINLLINHSGQIIFWGVDSFHV